MKKKLETLELNLRLQAAALESILEDLQDIQKKVKTIENNIFSRKKTEKT